MFPEGNAVQHGSRSNDCQSEEQEAVTPVIVSQGAAARQCPHASDDRAEREVLSAWVPSASRAAGSTLCLGLQTTACMWVTAAQYCT
jgi:hypothetical protein